MALIRMNLLSRSLMRTVNVNVILPADKLVVSGESMRTGPYQTLYLLHGLLGSENDWISGTAIQRWAEERDLAVVMPAGENSFYVDHEDAHDYYGQFIGSELVALTRKMFPLSERREVTFLAGLSMGGYGALRNGLKRDQVFGCVAALSAPDPVADVDRLETKTPKLTQSKSFFESRFGPADQVRGSDKDVLWLAQKLCDEGRELPKLFLACGKQDPLLEGNRRMKAAFQKLGFPVHYEERAGGHDWDFWNAEIRRVLDWLPLQEQAGIHSGNVGL